MPPQDNLSPGEVLLFINACAGIIVVVAVVLAALWDESLLLWLLNRGYTGIFEW